MIKVLKNNMDNIIKWANIVFLFLFSLHLFNFPDKYIILWCAFSIFLIILKNENIEIDKIFLVLSLTIVLNGLGTYYYLRESLSYSWEDIIKMVVPTIMVYPFMKQLANGKKDFDIEIIILSIAIGTFIYSALNYYMLARYGFYEGDYRGWSDFWTYYNWRATHYSYWGCFIAGLSGYGIYCLLGKNWVKGILICILVLIENYMQIAGDNRMVICVTVVSLFVSVVLYCVLNINNQKRVMKVLIGTVIFVTLIILAINMNALGIKDTGYYHRFVSRNGGILKNDRFQMIYEAIRMLPSHWKGGATMYAAGNFWVHNYWLQVANVSGIIPFLLWMIVNIATVVDWIKVLKSSVINEKIKYMILPLVVSIAAYFMMEPGGTESNRYIIFYIILIALLKVLANRQVSYSK